MKEEMYFDASGKRVLLDTRHLEWCSKHKPGVTTMHKVEQMRNRDRAVVFGIIKVIAFMLCLFFCVKHIGVFSTCLPQIVEGGAVISCLLFMGACVDKIWRNRKRK